MSCTPSLLHNFISYFYSFVGWTRLSPPGACSYVCSHVVCTATLPKCCFLFVYTLTLKVQRKIHLQPSWFYGHYYTIYRSSWAFLGTSLDNWSALHSSYNSLLRCAPILGEYIYQFINTFISIYFTLNCWNFISCVRSLYYILLLKVFF